MTITAFITYFSVVLLATIVPGPSMLLALNHGTIHGLSKSVYSGLGNSIGNLLIAVLSLLGLGAVLIASVVVFNALKWIGIAYLFFIGIKLIIKPGNEKENTSNNTKVDINSSKLRLFADGFIIAIGNPKGLIFFTALFPQLINTKDISISTLVILLFILVIIAFACYMLYVISGVKINSLFQKKSFKKRFNQGTGLLFILAGIILAFLSQ